MNGSHNKVLYLRHIQVSEKEQKDISKKICILIYRKQHRHQVEPIEIFITPLSVYFHAHTTGYEFSFFSSCCVFPSLAVMGFRIMFSHYFYI